VGVSRVKDAAVGVALIQAAGENDAYDADYLERALEQAAADTGAVVVDLRAATFVDSTFVGVLIAARSKLAAQALAVVVPDSGENHVARIFSVIRLAEALPVFTDLPAAVAAVADGSLHSS
jgi:anti-anti-sigma factor